MAPHFLLSYYSPSNLGKSWYPPRHEGTGTPQHEGTGRCLDVGVSISQDAKEGPRRVPRDSLLETAQEAVTIACTRVNK